MICPFCGSEDLVALGEGYVEIDEFEDDGKKFPGGKGFTGRWGCTSCKGGFIEWTPDEGEV